MDHEVYMETTGGGEEKPGDTESKTYRINFSEPSFIPNGLTSEPITFKPEIICNENGAVIPDIPIIFTTSLQRLPSGVDISNYVNEEINSENGTYTLKRNRMYLNGNLIINCKVNKEDSPSGEEMTAQLELTMSTRE